MNGRQLRKIAAELEAMRNRSGVNYREMETVAAQLGRTVRSTEGSHGQWISRFPTLRPVTIVRHRGDMKIGTKKAIIAQLEEDVTMWEEEVDE